VGLFWENRYFVISEERGTDEFGGVLVHITQISKTLQPILRKGKDQECAFPKARFSAQAAPVQKSALQRHGRNTRRSLRPTLLQKRAMEIAES